MQNQNALEGFIEFIIFCLVKTFKWLIWIPLVVLPSKLWMSLIRLIEGRGYKRVLAIFSSLIMFGMGAYLVLTYGYVRIDGIRSWQYEQLLLRMEMFKWFKSQDLVFWLSIIELLAHSLMSFVALSPIYITYAKYRLKRERLPFNLYDQKLRSEHCLVLGATGSGKTTTVIEPYIRRDIINGRGLLFMTAKEEQGLLDRILSYATECGREGDIQIFTLSDFPQSQIYNPLTSHDAMELRDMLFYSFEWDNPYYREQSKSALFNVISALTELGKSFSLRDLYYLLTDKRAMEKLASEVKDDHSRYHLDRYIQDWKTFTKNTHGLIANLEDYTNKRITARLSNQGSDINILDAYNQNKIVIFILNSLQYGESAKCLGKMVLQNIRILAGNIASSRIEAPKFFPVYVDEFHHFVYPQFFSMIAQCRSSNIGLMLSTQSFSDLKNETMDIVTQVIQNTNTKIILRQNDADSAELVAKLAGTQTVDFYTSQYETNMIWGQRFTGMGTVKEEEEFVIHPNIIKKMRTGKAVVIVKGIARLVLFEHLPSVKNYFSWNDWYERHGTKDRKVLLEPISVFDEIQARMAEKKRKGIVRKNTSEKTSNTVTPAPKGLDLIKQASK